MKARQLAGEFPVISYEDVAVGRFDKVAQVISRICRCISIVFELHRPRMQVDFDGCPYRQELVDSHLNFTCL